jgi:hypothetical protein
MGCGRKVEIEPLADHIDLYLMPRILLPSMDGSLLPVDRQLKR